MKSYITGSSISCSLGDNKASSIEKMKDLNPLNYESYLKSIFIKDNFYSIKDNLDKKTRFFSILKKVIFDAIADAKIAPQEYKDLHLYIGSTSMNISIIEQSFKETGKLGSIGNGYIANYIETLLGLQSSSVIFSTACTSSGNALIQASQDIKDKHIKKALVIGIELFNDATFSGFNSLMLLSQTGKYKPLDENSDGIVLGEACSAVILENQAKNNDDFYICGSKNIFDGFSETSSNPTGKVILKTMEGSLDNSNLTIEDLDLINAHAPGSNSSNEAEINALISLIKEKDITVSSMKPYIGHTLGACSLNEIVLLTGCIKNKFIPNTLGIQINSLFNFSKYKEFKKSATILFTYNGFSGNNISIIISNKG